jgi:hypothetical protein
MTRLTLALAVCISLVSVASASLTPRKEHPSLGAGGPGGTTPKLSTDALGDAAGHGTASEFKVTERTEILLDGKACRYRDVPEQATILRMEVAADGKTVLKIHFRTKK